MSMPPRTGVIHFAGEILIYTEVDVYDANGKTGQKTFEVQRFGTQQLMPLTDEINAAVAADVEHQARKS